MKITASDIQGLIAFAIVNNKAGLINALNSTGNATPANISDDDLLDLTWNIFTQKGLNALKNVLNRVAVDKAKVNQAMADKLAVKFRDPNSAAKFTDWFGTAINYFGDLIGGSSVSTTAPVVQQQTATPAISATTIIVLSVVGIIAIVILTIVFRK